MRRPAVVFATVPLAVTFGGGGGGACLGAVEYAARADAVCRVIALRQSRIAAPSTVAGIPAYADRALPLLDEELDRLRSLRPPQEIEDHVNARLKTTGETRRLLGDLRRAAEDGDAQRVRELGAKGTEIDDRRDALAREIGLADCANT